MATTVLPPKRPVAKGVKLKDVHDRAWKLFESVNRDLDVVTDKFDYEYHLGRYDAVVDLLWDMEHGPVQAPLSSKVWKRYNKALALVPAVLVALEINKQLLAPVEQKEETPSA